MLGRSFAVYAGVYGMSEEVFSKVVVDSVPGAVVVNGPAS